MKRKKVIEKINPIFLKGIAHRGLWNEAYSENSIGAFKNAIDNGFAFECDIHLTLDNKLVISHDSDLKRMTGRNGIIEELTLEEIKTNYTLHDGSMIPTLKEVLDLNQERVPMAIELKAYKKNQRRLVTELKKELSIKDYRNYFFISFFPLALLHMWSFKSVKGLITGKNAMPYCLYPRYLFNSVDTDIKLIKNKKIIAYSKKHFLNTWTVETKEQLDDALRIVDTVTFQRLDPEYVRNKLIEKNFK